MLWILNNKPPVHTTQNHGHCELVRPGVETDRRGQTVLHDNALDVDAPVLRAPDVELLGQYNDEGFSRPQYLLRRPDGQVRRSPAGWGNRN